MIDKHVDWIWMDGEFIPWHDAHVHLLTHTLHYGSGVFEGERAYKGKIFKMTEHHQRLHDSAALLDFKLPYSVAELNTAAEELLKRNQLTEAYLRPIAWHGSEAINVGSTKNSVHVAIAAWKWTSYFSTIEKGLKLTWAEWIRPAPTMSPVHAKATGQYIIGTLSKNKATQLGFHDAVMLDYRGFVAECTGANIFMVKNNILYTPIADCFLNGITRKTIIALAEKNKISVIEKHILPEELINADEIFITGSAAEIQPVSQIAEQNFHIGALTKHIMSLYHQLVQGEK